MGVDSQQGCLMANPLKALFDFVYLRRKRYLSVWNIEADLRIDPEVLLHEASGFSVEDLQGLASSYRKQTTQMLFEAIMKGGHERSHSKSA
jgi:hypothetical protein